MGKDGDFRDINNWMAEEESEKERKKIICSVSLADVGRVNSFIPSRSPEGIEGHEIRSCPVAVEKKKY